MTLLNIDLCARLPYGVKGKLVHNVTEEYSDEWNDYQDFESGRVFTYCGTIDDNVSLPIGDGDFTDDFLVFDKSAYTCFGNSIKPVLFNSLTEPITIKGKTFIPLRKMEELCKLNTEDFELRFENKNFVLYNKDKDYYSINDNCLFLFDKLNEWHINYRLSTDQFILATNEYE